MLDDLVPFVRFGQLVGLFPYNIKTNPLNARLSKRLNFSWRHPLAFWFVLVLTFQVAPIFAGLKFYINMPNEFKSLKLSLIFTIPLFVSIAVHYVTIVVSRAVTLRYHHLALVTSFPNNSDTIRELEEFETTSHTNTVKKRTYIGIFSILTTVQNVESFIFNFL